MKYWPALDMFNSDKVPRTCKRDIARLLGGGPSLPFATLARLHQASCEMPACTSLAIIQYEGAEMRRVYLKHPTQANWLALERGGFFATDDNFGFVMDALH